MSRKNGVLIVIALLLLPLAAWALGWFGDDTLSDDPTVAEIQREMRRVSDLPEDQRRQAGDRMRSLGQNLTDEQRMELFKTSIPMWQPMMKQRLSDFFAKTPEDQRAQIDEEIDRMEEFRQNNPGGGNGGPFRGGQNMSPEKRDEFMKTMVAYLSPDVRAMFELRIQMFNDRREERGLEPIGPPGMRR
ncbi:MAG: hypothetical protein CMJ58_08840 [Planctomycetaceae bacterium]|nr:hypothetical protein [Planctomycetaceae bacterium]